MSKIREKSVKVRFIEKQLELCQRKIDEIKNVLIKEEHEKGLTEGLEHEKSTLTHLLENCAE